MSVRVALAVVLAVVVSACNAGDDAAKASAGEASAQKSIERGSALFQRCAACHMATGKGVPGAFPPLAGRLGEIAGHAAGRDYLILVVSHGLTGQINVDGMNYNGFMPAQNYGLDAAAVADILNYAAYGLAGSKAEPGKPFTADEVASVQKTFGELSPTDVAAHRKKALGGD